MRHWLSNPKNHRTPRRLATMLTFRPRLESLEDRTLLSNSYVQTNLVSDIKGVGRYQDTNLVNPWGLAFAPGGPFWISDNGTGLSTLYNGQGKNQGFSVNVPGPTVGTSGTPTGIVFNGAAGFDVTGTDGTGSSVFIFATEDGTIAGWSPSADPNNAIIAVNNSPGAVYKGLAQASNATGTFLYATNFRAGTIDVFDSNFNQVTLSGNFTDPNLPATFAPFGIQAINGDLYVTYAKQDAAKHDDVPGGGHGFIDVFTTDGNLVERFATRGPLNSPWGLAVAPKNYGDFSNDLLVGNFGNGKINAFDLSTGAFLDALKDTTGHPLKIGGLWGLKFGGGAPAGKPNTLFFTAGTNGEADGTFGSLQAADNLGSPTNQDAAFGTDAGHSFMGALGSAFVSQTGPSDGSQAHVLDPNLLASLDTFFAGDSQHASTGLFVGGN
jgi:uncharacterized protein (TIGR03118 family)